MKRYISYFKYLFKHKYYVAKFCFSAGLIWRGIVHDISKFLPSEFIPYANFFYGKNGKLIQRRDSTGYYKPEDTGNSDFDYSWLLHQKRNKHHWQWWVCPKDDGGFKICLMDFDSIVEMVSDWRSAGIVQMGKDDAKSWYISNSHKILLHPLSKKLLNVYLNIIYGSK